MHASRHLPTRRQKRSEEGAVMMVVMLILLTTTAMAVVSLQSTQFELRAAGYNRAALQTQYVSEAGAATTLAWVDATAMDGSFLTHLHAWNNSAAPDTRMFGEPALPSATRQNSNRTEWRQQLSLTKDIPMAPLTRAGAKGDVLGSLGPRTPYIPGIFDKTVVDSVDNNNYVVDMYDCRQLPNSASAGSQVNEGGSGTLRQIQYYCVVTSRGGAYVPGAPSKTWTVQGQSYIVNRFAMGHDSRGAIVTPTIIRF